jgi:HEAT repeat protein
VSKNEIPSLIKNLADDDASIREYAAYVLGEKAAEARMIEQNTLKSSDQIEQQSPITEQKTWETAVTALIRSLSDADGWVRGNAADALGKFCDASAVMELEKALKDKDRVVRLAASEALGQIGDSNSIESLGEAVQDEEWSVRLSAVKALSMFQDSRTASIFEKAKGDPNKDVRLASLKALTLLTQVDKQAQTHPASL